MYIAHSNIAPETPAKPKRVIAERSGFGEQYSYQFFKKACEKHADLIAEIQKDCPDWAPTFNK
jgi:hypothetical protein